MIYGPAILGNDAELLAGVRLLFHAARRDGEFDPLRTEPTGAETVLVAALPEEPLVGFVLLTYAGPGLAALDLIYVMAEHRRQGIGRALVKTALSTAAAAGASKLLIGLVDEAAPMRALVDDLDFAAEGIIVARNLKSGD